MAFKIDVNIKGSLHFLGILKLMPDGNQSTI
jgi:hypothetical protein